MQWESDIVYVCETAERKGVKEMSGNTIHTLKRLMIEVNKHTHTHFHSLSLCSSWCVLPW